MKNFLDLLATKLLLEVTVNNQKTTAELKEKLKFQAVDLVEIDGIEILPKYQYLAVGGVLVIDELFYCWYHRVSGHGGLLVPC